MSFFYETLVPILALIRTNGRIKIMKIKIIAIVIVLVLVAIGVVGYKLYQKPNGQVACTEEAKICPDGSAVGRTGPKCEFAACPKFKNQNFAK